ncbi:MAG: hypothetical protein ACR2FY_26630 [Pirellulaceae bacterium]
MEPFSISCTTCKSRLKVKSQAAIGHLLKCPKCGGMVMVKLPEEPKPGDSAALRAETAPAIQKPIRPADAQDTLGENQDFDEVEALLATGAPKTPPPAAKSVGPAKTAAPAKSVGPTKTAVKDKPSRFAEGDPAPAANGAANGKSATHAAPNSKEAVAKAPAPPVPGSEVLPLPSGDWSSQRPWKSWLFLAVSILLGMGLAFGVVALSLSFFRDDTAVAGSPDQNTGEIKPAETVPDAGNPTGNPDATKVTEPKKSPDSTSANSSAEKSPVKPPLPGEKSKTEVTKVSPAPSTEEDPLGIGKKPAVTTKPAPPTKTNPFAKFDRLFGNSSDPTSPAPEPATTVPAVPRPAESPAEAPAKPSLPRPPARTVNIAARMNDALPGLTITSGEVTLADFLQSMQDFSTIPITLEPDNLAVFKQSASSTLPAYDGENLKFGELLTAVLTPPPLGLEVIVEDEQIIVRKPELIRNKMTRELQLMEVTYPMGDLTNDDEKQATELAERIMAVIDPKGWGEDDDENACSLIPGKDEFSVRQRLSAHVQFLTLAEKLRVARGLPLAGKGSDPETFRLVTRTEKAAARLAAPISLTFNRPTPLVKICQKLSAAGKMRILIDWRSIAASGWNPDAELTLVVDKKPLSEALTALVEPMDLAYRVVDGRTIQIVAPQYLAEHLELELHPAKELVVGQEQIEPQLARVRDSLTEGAAEPLGQFWLDPESKCLVAMLPQPKQQLLTKLLAEWRTKETN